MTNQPSAPSHSSGFTTLVSGLKQAVPEITVEMTKNLLDNASNKPFILIDVREYDEWDRGYIPGAIHVSKGILERDIEKTVPNRDAKIVLYCGGGSRSLIAGDNLIKMGYKDVSSMTGGMRGWMSAGYPVAED